MHSRGHCYYWSMLCCKRRNLWCFGIDLGRMLSRFMPRWIRWNHLAKSYVCFMQSCCNKWIPIWFQQELRILLKRDRPSASIKRRPSRRCASEQKANEKQATCRLPRQVPSGSCCSLRGDWWCASDVHASFDKTPITLLRSSWWRRGLAKIWDKHHARLDEWKEQRRPSGDAWWLQLWTWWWENFRRVRWQLHPVRGRRL